MLTAPKITDRDLGTLTGDPARWSALEDELAGFCQGLPAIDEDDEDAATRAYVERLAKAGLLRYVVPAAHGGHDPEVLATPICIVRQWLARQSGALDTAFAMQGLGSYPVTIHGTDALRASLLPRVVSGDAICAFALTEPDAGSDVSGMKTTAAVDGDGVRLSGEKCFISNAPIASSYVVFARESDPGADGKPRYGAFWIPGDANGITVQRTRVIAPHPIGTVRFDAVAVPAAHRIGAPGQGLRVALSTLDLFRCTVGAAALGFADRAIACAVEHLSARTQFGKPLAKQQGLRFDWAEVATDHLAAQLLVYRAASARDRKAATPDMPAMGKMAATESAQRAVDRAVQALGGLGVTVGQIPERLYREVRALRIYEGTTEIQKLVIARALFAGRG